MSASVPRVDSDYSLDGTEAHEVLAFALINGYKFAAEAMIMCGKPQTYRKDSYKERIDSVQLALDYVYDLAGSYGPDDVVVFYETQFEFPLSFRADCGGTADICVYIKHLNMLYVVDFKHGAGYAVEAPNNEQTMIYGVGAAEEMVRRGYPVDTIVLVIIQPRAWHKDGPIRTWLLPTETATEFVYRVEDAIMACEREDAPLIPDPEVQCRFCPAAPTCPAFEKAAVSAVIPTYNKIEQVNLFTLPVVKEMPVERLAYIRRAKAILIKWLDEVDQYAYELAMSGHKIPGNKLVYTSTSREYANEPHKVAEDLMNLTGASYDDVMPRKLIGIVEAEKLVVNAFKKNAPKGQIRKAAEQGREAFALLTTKTPSGKLTLVDDEDRRQEVNPQVLFNHVVPPPQQ